MHSRHSPVHMRNVRDNFKLIFTVCTRSILYRSVYYSAFLASWLAFRFQILTERPVCSGMMELINECSLSTRLVPTSILVMVVRHEMTTKSLNQLVFLRVIHFFQSIHMLLTNINNGSCRSYQLVTSLHRFYLASRHEPLHDHGG